MYNSSDRRKKFISKATEVLYICSAHSFLSCLTEILLLSMGLTWQEYWNGLPCPPPGDLPITRIKPMFPASMSLFLFCLFICLFFRFHIWVKSYGVWSFFIWFISNNIILWRSIYLSQIARFLLFMSVKCSIHQWTLRLFPCLDCCKYCCSEHKGACIFLN